MSRKGFTLIELLIVIAILGILVALILPRFADVREDANTKVCIANLRGLASAMATYEAKENQSIPWGSYSPSELVDWGYIAAEPFCPYVAADETSYELVANTGTHPDRAVCPKGPSTITGATTGDDTYADHYWPTND